MKKKSTSKVILIDNAFVAKQITEVVKPKLISMLEMIHDNLKLNLELRFDILPRNNPKDKFRQEFSDGVVLLNPFKDIEERFNVKFENPEVVFGHGSDGCSLEFVTTVKEVKSNHVILTSCFY